MRKVLAAAFLALLTSGLVSGHGGGLDRNGGHYNRKTGVYHCHRCPTQSAAPAQRKLSASEFATRSSGESEARVWVNRNSGVYHCPGTRWYGGTKSGEFMPESQAKREGQRPAYGKTCS